jgi:hypothetical protein
MSSCTSRRCRCCWRISFFFSGFDSASCVRRGAPNSAASARPGCQSSAADRKSFEFHSRSTLTTKQNRTSFVPVGSSRYLSRSECRSPAFICCRFEGLSMSWNSRWPKSSARKRERLGPATDTFLSVTFPRRKSPKLPDIRIEVVACVSALLVRRRRPFPSTRCRSRQGWQDHRSSRAWSTPRRRRSSSWCRAESFPSASSAAARP